MTTPMLVQAVAALDDAVLTPVSFADAMESAGRALGFDHFALVHSALDRPEYIAAAHAMDGLQTYTREGWIEVDYRAPTVGLAGIDELYLDHVVTPEEQRRRSTIFHELYVPKKMAWFAGWRSSIAGADWIFSLARGQEGGPVRPEEASLIRSFIPHAKRAALMARGMREWRAAGMAEGLAAAGLPSILLDDSGRAIQVTPSAAAMFGEDFGIRGGALWARHSGSMQELARLAAFASGRLDGEAPQGAVIRRADGRKPVSVQPLAVRGLGLDVFPGARLLLVLVDLDRKGAAAAEDLIRLFDLSAAEADVAVRLSAGDSLAEIATGRKVSRETVRVQLKSVLRKMDAGRQSDVVRVIDRLARRRP